MTAVNFRSLSAPGNRKTATAGVAAHLDQPGPELHAEQQPAEGEHFEYDAVLCVANWPAPRRHPWRTLLQARAVENLAFVLAAAQTGVHANGRETYGDSLIADPWGRVLARRPRGEGVVVAPIDREAQAARAQTPILACTSSSCQ